MDPLTLSATPKAWLLNSVLGPHAGSFVARLKHGRYSLATRRTYLGSLAHLARWMTSAVFHCDCSMRAPSSGF